jgi:hypothetical protein
LGNATANEKENDMSSEPLPVRPRDLSLMMLAAGDVLPRRRARDQQADVAGLELKRQLLAEIVAADPESEALGEVLDAIVRRVGNPDGPARAIARGIIEEFEAIQCSPPLWAWLVAESTTRSGE